MLSSLRSRKSEKNALAKIDPSLVVNVAWVFKDPSLVA